MIKDFNDKIVVITGAACGIGRELAQNFAQRGAKLALVDINEGILKEFSNELRSNGVEVLDLVVDVSNRDHVTEMAEKIYNKYEKVHILCNNAGVSVVGPAHTLSLSDWDWVLSVNLFGTIYGIHAFLPRMLQSGEPCHIINTSSLAGHLAEGSGGPYTTSKFATVGLTENLAIQYFNTKVKFSVLCPAAVKTDIHINSQNLGKNRSEAFNPIREKTQEYANNIELFRSSIEGGIDPKIVSEKVIEAISKNLFYIITHPEYMPLIEARFNVIKHETMLLNQEPANILDDIYKTDNLTVYEYSDPHFSVTYPKNWQQIPLPPDIPVKLMAADMENITSIMVMDKIPNMELKDVININVMFLNSAGNDVKIISNVETKLKDKKTIAYEGLIKYKRNGLYRAETKTLSTFIEDKIIGVTVGYFPHNYNENLKKILYSLKF